MPPVPPPAATASTATAPLTTTAAPPGASVSCQRRRVVQSVRPGTFRAADPTRVSLVRRTLGRADTQRTLCHKILYRHRRLKACKTQRKDLYLLGVPRLPSFAAVHGWGEVPATLLEELTAHPSGFPSEFVLCAMWPATFLRIEDTWDTKYLDKFPNVVDQQHFGQPTWTSFLPLFSRDFLARPPDIIQQRPGWRPQPQYPRELSRISTESKTSSLTYAHLVVGGPRASATRQSAAAHGRAHFSAACFQTCHSPRSASTTASANCGRFYTVDSRRPTARQAAALATARPASPPTAALSAPTAPAPPVPTGTGSASFAPPSGEARRPTSPLPLALPAPADTSDVGSPRTPSLSATTTCASGLSSGHVPCMCSSCVPTTLTRSCRCSNPNTTRTIPHLSSFRTTEPEPGIAAEEQPPSEPQLFPPSPCRSPEPSPATVQLQAALAVTLPPVSTPSPGRTSPAEDDDDTPLYLLRHSAKSAHLKRPVVRGGVQLQRSTQQQRAVKS
ncbi:hypothetical protein ACSSS7_002804 [Eimeria intestinalis]